MKEEQIKALKDFGKQAAIIYKSALDESGSTVIANEIVCQFIKAIIKPDSTKFFM